MIKTERKSRMAISYSNSNNNKNKLSQLRTLLATYQISSRSNSLAREREIDQRVDDDQTP